MTPWLGTFSATRNPFRRVRVVADGSYMGLQGVSRNGRWPPWSRPFSHSGLSQPPTCLLAIIGLPSFLLWADSQNPRLTPCHAWPSINGGQRLPPTSSPNVWLVAMSRSSFIFCELLRSSSCTRVLLVVPKMKALMTPVSSRLVIRLNYREKHRM